MAGPVVSALPVAHDRVESMSDARKRALDLLGRTLDWKDEESAEVLQRSEKTGSPLSKLLVERGVESSRIEVHGHGAEQARGSEGDLDGYALDRRVDIRLEGKAGEARVASSD